GADDPHCRKPLWWKEFKFEHETRNNFQPGAKQYDPVGFNQAQFDWYKKLISIRRQNPVLATGDITFMVAEGKKLAYKRSDAGDEILVLFNLGPATQDFPLPVHANYIDLLTGKTIRGNNVRLKSLTSAILKKIK
ncbi:MAG: DUF3459 domain-containing protein, partial [Bacteroidota bacterium]